MTFKDKFDELHVAVDKLKAEIKKEFETIMYSIGYFIIKAIYWIRGSK